MLNEPIHCTTALEVKLLAALVHERRLRMMAEPKKKPVPQSDPPDYDPLEAVIAGAATVRQIQQTVCRCFDISLVDLKSDRRQLRTTRARQAAVLLCHVLTMHSYPELGRLFGDRDHTTMLHAVRKMEWLQQELTKELKPADPLVAWGKKAFEKINKQTTTKNLSQPQESVA